MWGSDTASQEWAHFNAHVSCVEVVNLRSFAGLGNGGWQTVSFVMQLRACKQDWGNLWSLLTVQCGEMRLLHLRCWCGTPMWRSPQGSKESFWNVCVHNRRNPMQLLCMSFSEVLGHDFQWPHAKVALNGPLYWDFRVCASWLFENESSALPPFFFYVLFGRWHYFLVKLFALVVPDRWEV